MNVNPESPQATEETAADDAALTEPVKPARRKRAVKAAVVDVAAPEAAPVAVEAVVVEAVAVDAPAEDAAPVPKASRRKRTPVAEPLVDDAPPVVADAPAAVDAAPAVADVPADAGDAGEATEATEAVAAVVEGDETRSRRRGRQRRRGGRDDADAPAADAITADAAADDAEALPSEPAEPPADVGEVFAQVLSGEFDTLVEPPADPALAVPPKRVLRPEPEAPKLHKVLAQAGIGSRRDMEELILDGHITVNGQPAHIGQRISFGDQIKVNGKPVRVRIMPLPPRIIAYHKPAGEVVTNDDPQARPTVFRRLPRLQQGKWQSVGRLDINTEGLLLFTNSGELANRLMHPRFGVEREYAVRVLGTLDSEDKAQLLEGVPIDGQTASFRSIEDGGGEGANHWYRVVITEGRNREVRKLFDAVDLTVSRLIRIRYGCVVLPRGLKRGVWVDLEDADVRAIRQLTAGQGDAQGEPRGNDNPRGRNKNKNERRNDARQGGANEPRRNDRGPGNAGPNVPRQQPQPQAQRADDEPRRADLDIDDDFDPSRIPNPLEQTFDKRFVQNPRTPAGGRGFRNGGGGFGAGGSAPAPASAPKRGEPRQPDPMQTSVGYIGGDAFHRKGNRGGSGGGGGGGGGAGGNRGGNRGGGGQGQGGGGFGGNRRGR